MKSVCVFVWQELLERAEWGTDLPSVDQHLQDHHTIHTAVEDLLHSLKEARSYEVIHTPRHRVSHLSDPSIDRLICVFFFFLLQPSVSSNFRSSYSETLAKLENQYCKLLVSVYLVLMALRCTLVLISGLQRAPAHGTHTVLFSSVKSLEPRISILRGFRE